MHANPPQSRVSTIYGLNCVSNEGYIHTGIVCIITVYGFYYITPQSLSEEGRHFILESYVFNQSSVLFSGLDSCGHIFGNGFHQCGDKSSLC